MLIKLEKTLQGFSSLSIIFSGKHISCYVVLKMTVSRISFYCLKGDVLQVNFLVWGLHCGCLGLSIKNTHMKPPLTSA